MLTRIHDIFLDLKADPVFSVCLESDALSESCSVIILTKHYKHFPYTGLTEDEAVAVCAKVSEMINAAMAEKADTTAGAKYTPCLTEICDGLAVNLRHTSVVKVFSFDYPKQGTRVVVRLSDGSSHDIATGLSPDQARKLCKEKTALFNKLQSDDEAERKAQLAQLAQMAA